MWWNKYGLYWGTLFFLALYTEDDYLPYDPVSDYYPDEGDFDDVPGEDDEDASLDDLDWDDDGFY